MCWRIYCAHMKKWYISTFDSWFWKVSISVRKLSLLQTFGIKVCFFLPEKGVEVIQMCCNILKEEDILILEYFLRLQCSIADIYEAFDETWDPWYMYQQWYYQTPRRSAQQEWHLSLLWHCLFKLFVKLFYLYFFL